MATLKDVEIIVSRFQSDYRKPTLPPIVSSGIYSLFTDKSIVSSASMFWPETWPNSNERGVYAIFAGDTLLYIGKASLQDLGYRLSSYFVYSGDRQSAVPKKGHTWSKQPTSVVTWAVPREYFFEATALEEYLIFNLKDHLPDNTVGKSS